MKPGDCVTHAGGTVQMQILSVVGTSALCAWSDADGNQVTGSFVIEELRPCTPLDHSAP
jgi:hypothetical protein